MTVHDSHCHFLSERFYDALAREKYGADGPGAGARVAAELGWEAPGPPAALSDRWVAELDRNRVTRAALIASVPGDEESVAAAVARHPSRFVGFCLVNPVAMNSVDRARRALSELGMRCICLFPAMHRYGFDNERVAAIFKVAAEHRGAIFAHCGLLSIEARTKLGLPCTLDLRLGDPLALAATAVQFPDVPVIVPHFGGGFLTEALMAAAACPTIHFDTSSSNSWVRFFPGLSLQEVFHRALSVAGPDRLIFGSDSSYFPRGWRRVIHGAQVSIVDELGTEPEVARKIFSGNFDRIFPVARS
jgi:hypothetical protein